MIRISDTQPPTSAIKPLSVVVADDVEEIRNLVRQWLETLGHHVVCVGSGRELAALLETRPFDLVITDIIMPNGDGFEAILALKKHQPGAGVIAMSGGGSYLPADDCLRVAKGLGANQVLFKPFKRQQLLDAVSAAMKKRAVPA